MKEKQYSEMDGEYLLITLKKKQKTSLYMKKDIKWPSEKKKRNPGGHFLLPLSKLMVWNLDYGPKRKNRKGENCDCLGTHKWELYMGVSIYNLKSMGQYLEINEGFVEPYFPADAALLRKHLVLTWFCFCFYHLFLAEDEVSPSARSYQLPWAQSYNNIIHW